MLMKISCRGADKLDLKYEYMKFKIHRLYMAKSQDEDTKRHEYILNIILCVSILILTLYDLIILRNSLVKTIDYDGIQFATFTAIICAYVVLLILSKRGYIKTASYALIASYWAGALHCGYQWGASLPITLITFILVIFISSILISSKFGASVTFITIISFVLLGIHEYKNPEILSWRMDSINNTDLIAYSFFLVGIALLSWLSNKETERSLRRARNSENELKNERDQLEIKIVERTKELRESQLMRMSELERIAEFGRLSQGLFHDLISPLTSVMLHMEKIKGISPSELNESHASLEKIVIASKKMGENMQNLRFSLRNTLPPRQCSIADELNKCIGFLKFKIRENNISIRIKNDSNCLWFGDPVKLQQIFSNLITNAIDACTSKNTEAGKIIISLNSHDKKCRISIKDNGIGMDAETIKKIFDPFFTTKPPELGTGIGLKTVQRIMDEINGTISVKSIKDGGSTFILLLPLK